MSNAPPSPRFVGGERGAKGAKLTVTPLARSGWVVCEILCGVRSEIAKLWFEDQNREPYSSLLKR